MRFFSLAVGLLALSPGLLADLTIDQKLSDFAQLAGLYAKNYGPYELKRDVYGFDLYDVQPWIDQIKASKTDVGFFDICTKYVAGLKDSHDEFTIYSTFDAWLHFDGDIYDGKFVIDYIDRAYLSSSKYPFQVGDELVSVDGVAVAELLAKFAPYAVNGESSPVSRARLAAGAITERYQSWNPTAAQIGATATIVVNRKSTGTAATYVITWDATGDAVTTAGLVPSPGAKSLNAKNRLARPKAVRLKGTETAENGVNRFSEYFSEKGPAVVSDPAVPAYMKPLIALQTMKAAEGPKNFATTSGIYPYGSPYPVFLGALPTNFKLRLGRLTTDQFLSGTFQSGSHVLGYIRIWTMSPSNQTLALQQFATEVLYFQGNVDGLIIDVMANGGGSGCYTQELASMLIPGTFQGLVQEVRATLYWQYSFSSAVESAVQGGAPGWVVADYQFYLDAIANALKDNRARTGGLPMCSDSPNSSPVTDQNGNPILYTKPMIVLTDNFTLSAAEIFAMFMQDTGRAKIVGTTTGGGGGSVVDYNAGAYSEGQTRVTLGVIERAQPVQVPGFPSLLYYDGVGIYPDVPLDYMTVGNLNTGGADFVKGATSAILNLIPASGKGN